MKVTFLLLLILTQPFGVLLSKEGGSIDGGGGGNLSQAKATELARVRKSYLSAYRDALDSFRLRLGVGNNKVAAKLGLAGTHCPRVVHPLISCKMPSDIKLKVTTSKLFVKGDSEPKIAITEKTENEGWVTTVSVDEWVKCEKMVGCQMANPVHEFLIYHGVESNLEYEFSSEYRRVIEDGGYMDSYVIGELEDALDRVQLEKTN